MSASPSRQSVPRGVVELMRTLIVLFFAGVGYALAHGVDGASRTMIGPFTGVVVGVILGIAVGYVVGGVLSRSTIRAVSHTEMALREVSAETLVAGGLGMVGGIIVGLTLAAPLLLVGHQLFVLPLSAFVVVVTALTGARLAVSKREAVVGLFGASAGLAPRRTPAAAMARILDTSVAIDGRILDVVRAGFLHGTTLVPLPVIGELQAMADSDDPARRAKGRRALEVIEALKRESGLTVELLDEALPDVPEVDAKLVRLCLDRNLALLTLDTNLARAASVAGVRVLNLHALALALRPPVTAGDDVDVLLTKPGKEPGQAVGFLDDGTMVVVDRARLLVGEEVRVHVTSVLTSASGRMVFGTLGEAATAPPRRRSAARP